MMRLFLRRDPRAKGRPSRPPSPAAGFPGDGLRVTSPLSLCGELHHGDAAVIARLSSGGALGSLRRHTAQHTGDH
ncbi:hypothetical protein OYC64_005678 [Pagothenia borchgrevinki]|uniref:Uncharacterized protein n=1 Tax=Pagothenia borchgrevinki TaxID=8213 RepID=A0ABD2GGB8_PAGBO